MSFNYSFRGLPVSDLSVKNLWSKNSNIRTLVNSTSDPTVSTPIIPTPILLKLTTSDFIEGKSGPTTPSASFSRTISLPVKMKWCWVLLSGFSGAFTLQANMPGAPFIGGANPIPYTCFVTENYQDVMRVTVATTPTKPEQDPILVTSYAPSELIGQTYIGLRDLTTFTDMSGSNPLVQGWLFGVYGGIGAQTDGVNSIVLNQGTNKNFYTESIYLDNSGLTSTLVFKFKVFNVHPSEEAITFNGTESVWVYYQ